MERFFLELEPPEQVMRTWPHVVVVGGGFAGLKICHALARQPVRVTLIDKRNFNLFQPLLYQVASGLVSEADIASPLRQMVGDAPNIQILLGEVVDIDPVARHVVFNDQLYSYDQLVLATGSGSTYFGREDWRSLAPPMKILEHADEIRRRLLMALEEAEQTTDLKQRSFLQTVVVVGAGPAGCELAGSLIELMHRAVQRISSNFVRVIAGSSWSTWSSGCCPPWLSPYRPPPLPTWKRPGWNCSLVIRSIPLPQGACRSSAQLGYGSLRLPPSAGPLECGLRGLENCSTTAPPAPLIAAVGWW
jgi:hypothetical protein